MNMDYTELKPDYLRMATTLRLDIESVTRIIPSPISESLYKTVTYSHHEKYLNSMLGTLTNNEIPYDGENKILLENFLERYNLASSIYDFLFIANHYIFLKTLIDSNKIHSINYDEKRKELLSALKLLFSTNIDKTRIKIQNITNDSETVIMYPKFIDTIKNSLLQYFISIDSSVKSDIGDIENFQDWKGYFDYVIENNTKEAIKGRKPKHLITGRIIDSVQIYLQEYTEIKAEEGSPISRSQSSFIYEFLILFDLIPKQLSFKEDNIRLILTKYRDKNKLNK